MDCKVICECIYGTLTIKLTNCKDEDAAITAAEKILSQLDERCFDTTVIRP